MTGTNSASPLRGGTALIRLLLLFLIPLILVAAPSPGRSEPLLDKLDARYYYPQREGLKKLAFTIHWAQLDPFSDHHEKKLLNNPTVRFKWKAGTGLPEFELETTETNVSAEQELQILQFLHQYSEIFIPVPLSEKLSGFSLKGQRRGKRFLEARYIADHPQPVLQ